MSESDFIITHARRVELLWCEVVNIFPLEKLVESSRTAAGSFYMSNPMYSCKKNVAKAVKMAYF